MRKSPVCIYVDNSNIYIGGQEVAKQRHEDSLQFRIDFSHFLFLITAGSMEFDEMVWAGSGPHEIEEIFAGMQSKGVDLQIIPRSETGEHETVDQAIQLAMYRNHRKYRDQPGTIILCTGDGKGYHEEKGFLYDIKGFIEDGWHLALYSWDANCHHALKAFAKSHGDYIQLEDHYDSITFIKNERHAKPVVAAQPKKRKSRKTNGHTNGAVPKSGVHHP